MGRRNHTYQLRPNAGDAEPNGITSIASVSGAAAPARTRWRRTHHGRPAYTARSSMRACAVATASPRDAHCGRTRRPLTAPKKIGWPAAGGSRSPFRSDSSDRPAGADAALSAPDASERRPWRRWESRTAVGEREDADVQPADRNDRQLRLHARPGHGIHTRSDAAREEQNEQPPRRRDSRRRATTASVVSRMPCWSPVINAARA